MSCKTVSVRRLPRRLDSRAGRHRASRSAWNSLGGLALIFAQVGCLADQGSPEALPEVASAKVNALVTGTLHDEHCTQADQDRLKGFVVYAESSLVLGPDSTVVGGHVGVRDPNPASESLKYQLRLGVDASIDLTKTVFAKETEMLDESSVGALQTSNLDLYDDASYVSRTDFPESSPIPPVIAPPTVGGDDDDEMIGAGQEVTLAPGVYRDITLGVDSLVRLQAGNYSIRRLVLADRAWLIAQGTVKITVRERMRAMAGNVEIRPTSQIPGLTAKDFVIESAVGPQSMDADSGIEIGPNARITALIVAPNARADFGNNLTLRGTLIARRAIIGSDSTITYQDGVQGEACLPYDCEGELAGMINDNDPCTVDACTAEVGITHDPAPDGTVCDADGVGGACVEGECEPICGEQTQIVKGNPRLEYMATSAPMPTPSGLYVVRYVSGCMKYNPLWWWSVNGTEDGEYAWFLVEADKRQILPGTFGFFNSNMTPNPETKPGFQNFEDCVAANLEQATPIVVNHAGNDRMRIYLADHPYADNRHGLLGQNPTWSITPFECGAQ